MEAKFIVGIAGTRKASTLVNMELSKSIKRIVGWPVLAGNWNLYLLCTFLFCLPKIKARISSAINWHRFQPSVVFFVICALARPEDNRSYYIGLCRKSVVVKFALIQRESPRPIHHSTFS